MITQAINPPLNVETFDISGNYFSTLLFGVPDKLFIQGEGLTFSTSKQQQLLTQSNIVDPVNTKFQIALDSSLKEGNGSFQYIDFSNPQPEWNDVENVPVVVKPFLAFDKV